ncbi:hypothetical protein GCM10022198_23010 [Klugiella xanthotipulae]|uniref:WXG100 family type VII secretion target n=1 Tax=Klugiella xanthotipulae TaxID=244735 RepID=A0A543I603_9MICO|nr:WXG100 family type VII secretion target [Klugiella xanthotipulae]TQM65971.1 WXG100 family type VII secretion target [Klugiella xanthotipulae]
MKFAMGADVLGQLTKKTSSSSEDLRALVKQLAQSAEPLEGRFNGSARAAFDRFKGQTDQIAAELNAALAGVLGGISSMDRSFQEGEQEMAEQTRATDAGAAYDAARFSSSK